MMWYHDWYYDLMINTIYAVISMVKYDIIQNYDITDKTIISQSAILISHDIGGYITTVILVQLWYHMVYNSQTVISHDPRFQMGAVHVYTSSIMYVTCMYHASVHTCLYCSSFRNHDVYTCVYIYKHVCTVTMYTMTCIMISVTSLSIVHHDTRSIHHGTDMYHDDASVNVYSRW